MKQKNFYYFISFKLGKKSTPIETTEIVNKNRKSIFFESKKTNQNNNIEKKEPFNNELKLFGNSKEKEISEDEKINEKPEEIIHRILSDKDEEIFTHEEKKKY